jgi:aldose 1-epimerase
MTRFFTRRACPVCLAALVAVSAAAQQPPTVDVQAETVGALPDGTEIDQYTLSNPSQMQVTLLTYGATITGVSFPDRQGTVRNLTLFLDTIDDYLAGHPLFGSLVGRYANRIAQAAFTIDDQTFALTANTGQHHIHGGHQGFHKIVWQAKTIRQDDRAGVELTHTSPDGHEGYPGNLAVKVHYWLTTDNQLVMEYWAESDKPTHVNLTNHAYWNLAGAGSGNVFEQVMMINADQYVEADAERFPTGAIKSVEGTPLDFRAPQSIGSRINQLPDANYDDCYVLNKIPGDEPSLAARVVDPASGRVMEVYTTAPGVQFYTAKWLSDQYRSQQGTYGPYHGFCLETQHFPDSPNHPHFPSTLLRPGETYHQVTVHRFRIEP